MSEENQHPKVYTVSELTREIQGVLEEQFDFIWVEGEISNFSAPVSGHYYMVLKDEKAQLRAVMFRMQARYLKFLPENGMKVLAQGRIGVYPPRGEYQIILDYLEPMGVGALAVAFEQLKRKLSEEGLFDEEIKKPLPFLPQRVAVVTSPTGAAIRDFLKIVHRRFANLEIIVVPVRVQGEEAAPDMVKALDMVNEQLKVDVIVLTRGGGSLEDLWAFNDEALARAIRRSNIPVVSAVGHEIDLTISDLAADFRAPTPSAAAELLVVEKEGLRDRIYEMRDRLGTEMLEQIKGLGQKLEHLSKRLQDPRKRLAETWLHLDEIQSRILRLLELSIAERKKRLEMEARNLFFHSPLSRIASINQQLGFHGASLERAMKAELTDRRSELSLFQKRLEDLSPLSILKRGYSITYKIPQMAVLRESSEVQEGDRVRVRLARGEIRCTVDDRSPEDD